MTLKLGLIHILDAILMIVKRDKSRASLLPARGLKEQDYKIGGLFLFLLYVTDMRVDKKFLK